jgi:diadenylate cyclase
VIDEVVDAATDLARHRIGALIAFEQDANLDEFVGVHKGHPVDSQVTAELLVSLFVPEAVNKLHDGAVIIRNYRIAKAGVFFPMPEGRVADDRFGSRHRAALGITEETDAVVVIVSEERGTISFCFNGNIASNLDGPKLKTMLEAIFSPRVRKKSRRAAAQREATREPVESVRLPESARRSEVEVDHPRISLVADSSELPPVVRSRSEPPPPLRPAQSPNSPLATPNPATPLRTPPSPHAAPRIEAGEIISTPSESKPRGDS